MTWEYIQPVRILFGDGRKDEISAIAKEAGLTRGFLVCDRFLVESGVAQRLLDHSAGMLVDMFYDIAPNPTTTSVDACAAAIRAVEADFVVALGGGSAMDAAKAAAVLARTDDSVTKYHGTGVPLPDHGLPIIALPTTAGTGSEVTPVSVLTNEEKGLKAPMASRAFYPIVAIIDPALTYTVPSKVVAQTGLDVLCHAVEAYMSIHHQPICDALAIQATRLVFRHLPKAAEGDKAAQDQMALASLLAGLAFGQPKTGAPHACSFVLTTRYGIPHGEACALTLDYFLEIAATGEPERLEDFARQTGFQSVKALVAEIRTLKGHLGLLMDLKAFNLTDEEIKLLVEASQHLNMQNSPVAITEEMLFDLYERMR